jgi:hypothetical protein
MTNKDNIIHQSEVALSEYAQNDKTVEYFDKQIESEKAQIELTEDIENL